MTGYYFFLTGPRHCVVLVTEHPMLDRMLAEDPTGYALFH